MKAEHIIISLTSWAPRFNNLPMVLDSIFAQTYPPDKVVLNIDENETIPDYLEKYISEHGIEVFFTPNTRVYKKLIPTLKRYPESLVISIDDDWIYPETMIEDFMNCHMKHPDQPISGNREKLWGMNCHCGCASLTEARFFGQYLYKIDDELIRNCPSDDIVYTFLVNRNGYSYARTDEMYFENMQSINPANAYSASYNDPVTESYVYMISRFGHIASEEEELTPDLFSEQLELINTGLLPGSKNLAIVLNAPEAYYIPYFLRKLLNIRSCKWTLFVNSVSKDSPVASDITRYIPDAIFVEKEKSYNGMIHLNKMLLSSMFIGYDAILHLNTPKASRPHIFNYMYMKIPLFLDSIVNPLIGSCGNFDDSLEKLDKYALVCSDACYKYTGTVNYFPEESKAVKNVMKEKGYEYGDGKFPSGCNFLCRTDALSAIDYPVTGYDSKAEVAAEGALFATLKGKATGLRGFEKFHKRAAHLLFSAHTYSSPLKKIIFFMGIPIVSREK